VPRPERPTATVVVSEETLLAELLPIDGQHFEDGDEINMFARTHPRRVELQLVRRGQRDKPYCTISCQTVAHFDRMIGKKLEELGRDVQNLPPKQRRGTLEPRTLAKLLQTARAYLAEGELPLGQGPSRYAEAVERQAEVRSNLKRPEIQELLAEPRSDGSIQTTDTGWLAREMVDQGNPYYWSPQYCELVRAASDSLERFTVTDEMLPGISGFAWLGKPLPPSTSFEGEILAIGWRVIRPEQVVYGRKLADACGAERFAALAFFGRAFNGTDNWNPIVPLGSILVGMNIDVPINSVLLANHQSVAATAGAGKPPALTTPMGESTNRALRWWCASLAFLNQRILVDAAAGVDRATRRRLEQRQGNVASQQRREPTVRVIHLRKTVRAPQERASDAEKREVDWACSWITRGHWREQPYKRAKVTKTIWIAPYPKGPADKPLRGAEKLFVVDR
jgi:hypothetical protein